MIKFLRSFLMVLLFALFGAGSVVVGLIIFPLINLFSKNKKQKYSKIIHISWNIFLKLITKTKMIKLNIQNFEEIKNIKNSIIVSTHPSYIDVLIILALIPKTTCFVAPKISRNCFFKNIAKSMFLISGNPLETIIKDAKEALNEGFNVLIFPMGTRHKKNEFPKIKKGAATIALETKRNIAVLKMTTNEDFLQVNQPFYDAGEKQINYDISFVKTINTADFANKENDEVLLRRNLTNEIKTALYD